MKPTRFVAFAALLVGALAMLAPETPDHQHPATGIHSAEQWAKRRAAILRGFQDVAGPLPDRATLPALDVKTAGETKRDGFTVQSLSYVADQYGRVPADLYLPEPHVAGKKYPAIVALQQTSERGKADLGGAGKPNMGYAPELARRGYIVICPDYPSFGDLKGYDFAADTYVSGTMKGIVDHMRAVDVLIARNDVDADRIGTIGHSLGGHNAIFLGVCDPRIKVVVSSCGWTPFHDYYGGNLKGWTQDRYMPRIRDTYNSDPDKMPFDFPELIAAIAPRAFFSNSPTHDANFDVEGVKRGIAAAQPIYELFGAKDKLQVRHPDGTHDFTPEMRAEAFAFIDRILANEPPKPAAKKEVPVEEQDFSAELPRIPGKTPAEALKTFQTHPGFHMELAASEPNVASPVAISFDEDGRMFICEMRDYSEQDKERLGRIRMLEDKDGDGRYETATIFAEDLSWPTALITYNGGLFVAAPPEVYWLKDTNGDGKADERKVVFTGFNRSNVQGLMNSFQWGLDNRIHGATSTSGGKVRRPEQPESEAITLSGRDFSFDPKTLEMRPESGGAQHGMSFDDWGRKFVSSNSDHIQMVMVDDRYLAGNPNLTVPSARESIAADGPQAKVFRISPIEPWRIVRTRLRVSGAVKGIVEGGGQPAGYFTGATGVTIYRGDAFPSEYRGQAFIGDVGSNIVHRKILEPNGVGFIAKRVDEGTEFVASSDIWFRPAQFANTPDGTLYIIDVYRETIEHPASLPPMIKKHLDLTSGRDQGRIWRLAPDNFKPHAPAALSKSTTADLVALLENRNGCTRDTASRLLYERQDKAAIPLLEKLATTSKMPEARVHAMYALASFKGLMPSVLVSELNESSMPRVQEHAVRLVETLADVPVDVVAAAKALAASPDARVRYQVALTSGVVPALQPAAFGALLKNAGDDRWMRAAVLALAGEHAPQLLASTLSAPNPDRATVSELARQAGAGKRLADVLALLSLAEARPDFAGDIVAGLSDGLTSVGASLRKIVADDPEAKIRLAKLLADARQAAAADRTDPAARASALRLLPIGAFADSKAPLAKALGENQPQDVQLAALAALDRFSDADVGTLIVKAWPGMTPAVRNAAANVIFARPERASAFLDAVEAGKIKSADVDRARLKTLEASEDPKLRDRAKKIAAAAPVAGRQDVFEKFKPALSLKGDASHGKITFEKTCAACHKLNGDGNEIGPNLAAMQSRGAEAILLNLINPNAEVNPQFVSYVVQTKSGRTTSGILASETASSVTLKRAGNETETIARSDIKRMRSSGLSIMPEGLEQGLEPQGVADLIAYILSAK